MSIWKRLFRRELKRLLTDRRIVVIMLAGPFFYAFLFGGVYWQGRVREIPIVIVDQDHSEMSRDLSRALLASENLSLAFFGTSTADFFEATKRGRAYACVVIPKDFQRDILRGRQGRVAVLLDGSNILIGNVLTRSISAVIAAYRTEARARRLMAGGVSRARAAASAAPIQAVVRPLFNPASHYGYFILAGLIIVALQQVVRIGAAISLSLDAGSAARAELARIGGHPMTLLTAKVAATAALMLPAAFVAIRLPFDLFGSPFRGNWLLAFAILTVFVIVQILVGYGVSGICRSALLSLHALLLFSVPAFILSGFTWPSYAMPGWLKTLSWLIPLTHVTDAFRKIALMGAGAQSLWPQLAVLIAWLPLSVLWGYWGLKRQTALHHAS
jgi:ABC-2 type transport system permease protein